MCRRDSDSNCPLDEAEYDAFWQALTTAQEAEVHGFEDGKVFEGCMPVEVMARRGHDTLCYGPLKPRGLKDPRTGCLLYTSRKNWNLTRNSFKTMSNTSSASLWGRGRR